MKTNLLKLLINIKTYTAYYFAVISLLGVIWGAFTVYADWARGNEFLHKSVTELVDIHKDGNSLDSILLINQKDMKEQLDDIQHRTKSLENSYVQYIARDKTLTKQDFLKYMNGLSFDVKKNSMNQYMIPLFPHQLNQDTQLVTKDQD